MSFSISLYYNPTEKNAFTKSLIHIATFEGVLRDDTSIIDPVIILECELQDIAGVNYMHIPMFGRYYFINNMTSLRTRLVEISAHVDVLSSFGADILRNNAIIRRQENKFNLYLPDGKIGTYSKPSVSVKKFSESFSNHEFILTVLGGRRSSGLEFVPVDITSIYQEAQTRVSSVAGSAGIQYDYKSYDGDTSHTYTAYVGGKLFRSSFTSAGIWSEFTGDSPAVEHQCTTDRTTTTVWIPHPKGTDFKVKVYRTNVGYDSIMNQALQVIANTDPTNPDTLVSYNLINNTDLNSALEITFPHDEKVLTIEYCDAGITP